MIKTLILTHLTAFITGLLIGLASMGLALATPNDPKSEIPIIENQIIDEAKQVPLLSLLEEFKRLKVMGELAIKMRCFKNGEVFLNGFKKIGYESQFEFQDREMTVMLYRQTEDHWFYARYNPDNDLFCIIDLGK